MQCKSVGQLRAHVLHGTASIFKRLSEVPAANNVLDFTAAYKVG